MTGLEHLPGRFLFLRHGRTAWNAKRLVMGQKDIPLDAVGEAQARDAAARLLSQPVSSVWTSPLIRCRATAAPFLAERPALPLTLLPGLAERGWGVFEGRLDSDRPSREETPEGGEGMEAFRSRTLAAFLQVTDTGLPLILSHSGCFRVLLEALGLEGEGPPVGNATPILVQPQAAPAERVLPLD